MQIAAIAVYNRDGRIRPLRFNTGRLNILTGRSKTGKSAVLDLVDYCLGRDEVTLPVGIITEVASWFAVLLAIGDLRILIARPNPDAASTNQVCVRVGAEDLDFPEMSDLRVNSDTNSLKDQLSELVGVEQYIIEPVVGSLRSAFDVSIRQALLLCFQKQTEIANQLFLFHRQAESNVATAIRDTLPYFLGAEGPEVARLRQQHLAARRALLGAERDLAAARQDEADVDVRLSELIREAENLGLVRRDPLLSAEETLRRALTYTEDADTASVSNADGEAEGLADRQPLIQERASLRRQLRDVDDELRLVQQLISEEADVASEASIQANRLEAVEYVATDVVSGLDACPLCDQALPEPDPTVTDLLALRGSLDTSLRAAATTRPRRDSVIRDLAQRRSAIVNELKENTLAMEAADRAEQILTDYEDLRERRIFLQGRISQQLTRSGPNETSLADLAREVDKRRSRLLNIERLMEDFDGESRLRSIIDEIGGDMTRWAQRLELEHSEDFVRLDLAGPTVVAFTPGGRSPLRRIGSAENWVGYHLVAHLALHRWLTLNERPVPRFIMFDQPSQAFFPEEAPDAADIQDADWEAVRRQFMLMWDVVESLEGNLQIIVCDHANLDNDWFQDNLVDNWRGGKALIPEDWLGSDTA